MPPRSAGPSERLCFGPLPPAMRPRLDFDLTTENSFEFPIFAVPSRCRLPPLQKEAGMVRSVPCPPKCVATVGRRCQVRNPSGFAQCESTAEGNRRHGPLNAVMLQLRQGNASETSLSRSGTTNLHFLAVRPAGCVRDPAGVRSRRAARQRGQWHVDHHAGRVRHRSGRVGGRRVTRR